MSWEDKFTSWAKAPGNTEQQKCDNAETAIRKALAAHSKLSTMDVTVFAQGSYRNKTNVRMDSDVDICVRLNSTFFPQYPEGKTKADFGNVDGSITFADYQSYVHEALNDYFGSGVVNKGDKAFKIHANTYRVDADVVASFEHRRYMTRTDGSSYYLSGIEFVTKAGKHVTNWPNQHYDNGLEKHNATGRRFRKVIRMLKRLRNEMQDSKIVAANSVASCLIECLVWNVPNDQFGHDTYTADVRAILAHLFNNTMKDELCSEWGEVSELLYLFKGGKPWTREQAHAFISAAWDYIGFK
jgi:hypothetical protein